MSGLVWIYIAIAVVVVSSRCDRFSRWGSAAELPVSAAPCVMCTSRSSFVLFWRQLRAPFLAVGSDFNNERLFLFLSSLR